MGFDDYVSILKRSWHLIAIFTLLGAMLGVLAAVTRPVTYKSTAVTSVVATSANKTSDMAYSTTQAIRVTMPSYLAEASGSAVAQAAARATGMDVNVIDSGLSTTREPDSTVINWALTTRDADNTQRALEAATEQFSKAIAAASPTTDKGDALVSVQINQPATAVGRNTVSPILGGVLGALAGALGALALGIMRRRWDYRVTGRDTVELGLATPVVAELEESPQRRSEGWRYVAAFLQRQEVAGRILLVGGARQPTARDASQLQELLASMAPGPAPEVRTLSLSEGQGVAEAASRADAVVLVLVANIDDTQVLRAPINSLHKVCPGPVVAVLDHQRDRQATDAPVPTKAATKAASK